jgi:hypothetical protein
MRKGVEVPARGETSEEFVDIMCEIRDRVKYVLANPLYCFDQPTIHVGSKADAYFQQHCFKQDDFFRIPPYSGPDFNKVIEHAHARLLKHIQPWINSQLGGFTTSELFRQIDIAAHEVNRPSIIRADVMSLRQTYRGIVANHGDYGPKCER